MANGAIDYLRFAMGWLTSGTGITADPPPVICLTISDEANTTLTVSDAGCSSNECRY